MTRKIWVLNGVMMNCHMEQKHGHKKQPGRGNETVFHVKSYGIFIASVGLILSQRRKHLDNPGALQSCSSWELDDCSEGAEGGVMSQLQKKVRFYRRFIVQRSKRAEHEAYLEQRWKM